MTETASTANTVTFTVVAPQIGKHTISFSKKEMAHACWEWVLKRFPEHVPLEGGVKFHVSAGGELSATVYVDDLKDEGK